VVLARRAPPVRSRSASGEAGQRYPYEDSTSCRTTRRGPDSPPEESDRLSAPALRAGEVPLKTAKVVQIYVAIEIKIANRQTDGRSADGARRAFDAAGTAVLTIVLPVHANAPANDEAGLAGEGALTSAVADFARPTDGAARSAIG